MERLASFTWQTPPPSSINEQLVLYDDGSALLVVRRPRVRGAAMGTYTANPAGDDFARLGQTGGSEVSFDLLRPDQTLSGLMSVADRVAQQARQNPLAVATFHCQPYGEAVGSGGLRLSLAVVASGQRPVQFDLEPGSCALHFSAGEELISWQEFPRLETGFVTPEAEGLGGLGRRAIVAPGSWGAISLSVARPEGSRELMAQVAGWLHEALPDDPMPARFEVKSDPAPI